MITVLNRTYRKSLNFAEKDKKDNSAGTQNIKKVCEKAVREIEIKRFEIYLELLQTIDKIVENIEEYLI